MAERMSETNALLKAEAGTTTYAAAEEASSSARQDQEGPNAVHDDDDNHSVVQTLMENAADALETISEGVQAVYEKVENVAGDVAENIQEVTEVVVENVQEVAVTVRDAVAEEVCEVAEIIVDDLHEADDGDLYFLEMGLARNLSILPGDVAYAAHHPEGESVISPLKDHTNKENHKTVEVWEAKEEPSPAYIQTIPALAYLLLGTAVLSLSSIGPLLDVQKNATATMKLYWRMAATALALLPFAVYEALKNGFPKLNKPQWCTFLLSTLFYDVMCLGFVLALDYTAVGNAVILANSQSLILLMGKLFVGERVIPMEAAGAMVAFTGAVLCSKDSAESAYGSAMDAVWGDLFAIASSLGGVGYLIFAKTVRMHMTLFLFMFLTMLVGSLMILTFEVLVQRESVTLGMERETGVFGFLRLEPDRLPLQLVMVVVCNVCGTMGYVRAMQYFDNIVISTAALMEPVAAEFLAFAFGVSNLPGWMGWLGNALVASGTFAVVYPASRDGKGSGLH